MEGYHLSDCYYFGIIIRMYNSRYCGCVDGDWKAIMIYFSHSGRSSCLTTKLSSRERASRQVPFGSKMKPEVVSVVFVAIHYFLHHRHISRRKLIREVTL